MSESMVGRVARAIGEAIAAHSTTLELFDKHGRLEIHHVFENESFELRPLARAAIEAMREPTEEMKVAGDELLDDTVECGHNVWNAMITAALKEPVKT